MLKRFLIYGSIGWIMEIMWTGLDSLIHGDLRMMGFTNLWMFVIYGCAVFLEPLHHIIAGWRWPLRGFVWLAIIWAAEYFSGLILVHSLGVYPWHYSDRFSIDGLITLTFAPVWFFGGLLFERIHRILDSTHLARN